MAQFYCGCDTLVCDAYGIKSTKQFINTLSDNIRKQGAMDTLISDGGKYEISQQVTDLLLIQFPPKMDEDWLRYELLNLGQIYETKLAEDVVLCVHNTTSALNS